MSGGAGRGTDWTAYQHEIFRDGLSGALPRLPTDLNRLEAMTEGRLGSGPVGTVVGAAGDGSTARANREAFDQWRIVPRMLRDVRARDLSVRRARASAARSGGSGARRRSRGGAPRGGEGRRPRGGPWTPAWTVSWCPTTEDVRSTAPSAPSTYGRRLWRPSGEQLEVLFDSGVRTGDDVFKAMALGARAVLLGRPYVYGLALDGQSGVEHVVRTLLAEFELTLALSGFTTAEELGPQCLVRAPGAGPAPWTR